MPLMSEDRLAPKTVAESRVELTQLMEATDVNIAGTVHGGVVMRLVDTAAGLAAVRHARGLAVVAIDEMTFLEPVHIGDVLVLRATVNDVGTTSMECACARRGPRSGHGDGPPREYRLPRVRRSRRRREPRPVPPLVTETDTEQRRRREAKLRRTARLAHKEAVKVARAGEDARMTAAGVNRAPTQDRGTRLDPSTSVRVDRVGGWEHLSPRKD